MIERTFQNIPDGKVGEADQHSFLVGLGWSRGTTWEEGEPAFFLDSIDELKLSRGSFERALKRLIKGIGTHLRSARIVITARPIPFDEQLVRQLLPIPPALSTEPLEEKFAKIAMGDHQQQREDKNRDVAPEWRSVALTVMFRLRMMLSTRVLIHRILETTLSAHDPDKSGWIDVDELFQIAS